jgi:hypothetical protein
MHVQLTEGFNMKVSALPATAVFFLGVGENTLCYHAIQKKEKKKKKKKMMMMIMTTMMMIKVVNMGFWGIGRKCAHVIVTHNVTVLKPITLDSNGSSPIVETRDSILQKRDCLLLVWSKRQGI